MSSNPKGIVPEADGLQRNLPAIGAAVRTIVISIAVLSIPLATAETLGLSRGQTSSWILAIYGLPAALSLIMVFLYRQPLRLTGNIFVVIAIAQLGRRLGYPEIVGAAILAGAAVLIIGALGLTERLARWIPLPVVFGLLAGAVLPFVIEIWNQIDDAPLMVGGTVLVYLASRGLLRERVPAVLPALIAGFAIAALTGQFGEAAISMPWELPVVTLPVFSLTAILAAAPVFVVLITLQSNMPSVRFLQSQGYCPPALMIDVISGISTIAGSLLGPIGVSLSLPIAALVAGPDAVAHAVRHRAAYLSAGVSLIIGLLAGLAASVASAIPLPLLRALAGLAGINVLIGALGQMVRGPLLLGPVLAFVIALSDISMLGFGPSFWALLVGTGASWLVEREEMRALRTQVEDLEKVCRVSS